MCQNQLSSNVYVDQGEIRGLEEPGVCRETHFHDKRPPILPEIHPPEEGHGGRFSPIPPCQPCQLGP